MGSPFWLRVICRWILFPAIFLLYWDRNGFCLWQKRLEKHYFRWPQSENQLLQIDQRQLSWLLEGLEFQQAYAHGVLNYRILA